MPPKESRLLYMQCKAFNKLIGCIMMMTCATCTLLYNGK